MRASTPLNLGGRAAEVDLSAVRAHTPPSVWQGAEEVESAFAFFGARAHRGVSGAAHRENVKYDQLSHQIERQRKAAQKPGQSRRAWNLDQVERSSQSSSVPTSPTTPASPLSPGARFRGGRPVSLEHGVDTPNHALKRDSIESIVDAYQLQQASRRDHRKKTLRGRRTLASPDLAGLLGEGTPEAVDMDLLVEEFNEDTSAIERDIEELTRNIRLEHLALGGYDGPGRDQRLRAEREAAEQRRREQERRAARKREAEARDPHRKIALKIENKRLFGEEDASVPMHGVDFLGSTGAERVTLVDVRLLRSRCMQLEEGASVKTLLDAQARKDRRAKDLEEGAQAAAQALRKSASLPDCLASQSALTSSLIKRPSPAVNNERRKRVQQQKKAQLTDSTLRRLYLMRSEFPDTVTERWGNVAQKDRSTHDAEAVTRKTIRETLMRSSLTGSMPLGHRMTKAVARNRSLASAAQDMYKAPMAPQMRRHWCAARALAQWLVLYFCVSRRHRAMDRVKALLVHVSEWARVRSAMNRVLKAVRKVQSTFREYRAQKRSHLEIMDQAWQDAEDGFLQSYFRLYFRKIFEVPDYDAKDYHTPDKMQLHKEIAEMRRSSLIERIIDWHKFRIPEQDRRLTIEQYYRVRQKRHVHAQEDFLSTIRTASGWQKDLEMYMQQLGTGLAKPDIDGYTPEEMRRTKSADVEAPAFWHLSEETALGLISFLAKGLKDTDPFQDHPANHERLEKVVSSPTKETDAMKHSAPAWIERQKRDSTGSSSSWKHDLAESTTSVQVDLDEILQSLTPRILETVEDTGDLGLPLLGDDLRRPSLLVHATRTALLPDDIPMSGRARELVDDGGF